MTVGVYEDLAVRVAAIPAGRCLMVWCPWCGEIHSHGGGVSAGAGNGIRRSHCGRGWYEVTEITLS